MDSGVAGPVQATAFLAAACRAAENTRPRPRLRDELAGRFVAARPPDQPGYRGLLAAGGDEVVARTVLLDELLLAALSTAAGPAPVLVSLGAGFCTRPYRLDLSACRQVVEVDAGPVLAVKERVLAGREPTCPVRRVALDLRDRAGLARLLAELAGPAPVLVVTEGVLPYLPPAGIGELASTLVAALGQARWLTDLLSVESARGMAQLARSVGAPVEVSGLASLAPFERHGWVVTDYRILPAARRGPVGRLPAAAPQPASHRVVDGVVALHHRPASIPGVGR
jgi:methyltransferase (TIGR00027 family)